MAYILVERVVKMDGTVSPSMTTYPDIDTAKGHAKQDMGNWMLNATCRSIGTMVLTEQFGNVTQDYWERFIPRFTFTVEGEEGEVAYSLTAEQGAKSLTMGEGGLYDGDALVHECAGVADTPDGEPYAQGATVWAAGADKRVYEVEE